LNERVIENWLTNANELSFTVPFAQVLALQGHTILHISPKKATLEQGKDIISVDGEGAVHCYQLKGGDVTLDRWRSELRPEIDALTELPPQHPSIRRGSDWICHLVINGELKGEATREITDTQNAREQRGAKSFDVILRGALLRQFTDVYGKYLPRDLDDFAAFIDLHREDGLEPLDKPAMAKLIESLLADVLSEGAKSPAKNAIRQRINASLVSVSYLLSNKYRQLNHVAIVEGWLMQLGYILAVVERHGLDEKFWRPAADLIQTLIAETFGELLDELEERTHYAQPASMPYADAYVYRLRVTIVAGYLAAFGVYWRLTHGVPGLHEDRIEAFLDKVVALELPVIKSEGQIPLVANIALFYQLVGKTAEAQDLVAGGIMPILYFSDKGGMFDPYIDVQDIIRTELGITLSPVRRNFGRNSYVLAPMTLLAAQLDMRELLGACWRHISHISTHQLIPVDPWNWYFWRRNDGKLEATFPAQTQSWQQLVAEARRPDHSIMPQHLRSQPGYIPLFLCLMPHRMSSYAIRTLVASLQRLHGKDQTTTASA
jgi:hypothetical protein